MSPDQINHPEVVAEMRAVFERYEQALLGNDIPALDTFFWHDASTLRYGIAEHSLGIEAIRAYRAQAQPVHPGRTLSRTVISTFGFDAASVCTEFLDPGSKRLGRQTQTWIRFKEGWRIVAAHVSTVDPATLRLY